ncbi:KAP family P-loop NTPase fold protein [Serratia marcescens]
MSVTKESKFSRGFHTDDDIFNRKPLYDLIIRVATKAPDENLVVALDDKWGNGKTSFINMMESEIKINENKDVDFVYFDAFENDYQSDPFVALSSKIYTLVSSNDEGLKSLSRKMLHLGKKVGASFAINGAKFAVSALTGGLVNGTKIEQAKDAIIESISSPIEGLIESKIKSGEDELYTIEAFRCALSEIAEKRKKKIIFVIDELDRARPDFALDLLEKVKHIFSVKGFVFLLVMNRSQFEKSIECRYGGINSRLYLNKFVHYWFTLPKKNHLSDYALKVHDRSTILSYLLHLDRDIKIMPREGRQIKLLSYLLEANGCSLREAERCYSIFSIMDNPKDFKNYNGEIHKLVIVLVAFLKIHNQELLDQIIFKAIPIDEVFGRLNINGEHLSSLPELKLISSAIKYHFATEEDLFRAKDTGIYKAIEGAYGDREYIFESAMAYVEFLHFG